MDVVAADDGMQMSGFGAPQGLGLISACNRVDRWMDSRRSDRATERGALIPFVTN